MNEWIYIYIYWRQQSWLISVKSLSEVRYDKWSVNQEGWKITADIDLFYLESQAAIQTFLVLAIEECLINTGLHVSLIYSRRIFAGGVVYWSWLAVWRETCFRNANHFRRISLRTSNTKVNMILLPVSVEMCLWAQNLCLFHRSYQFVN